MTITRVFLVGDIDIYQPEFNWLAFAAYTAKREVRGFNKIFIYTYIYFSQLNQSGQELPCLYGGWTLPR